MLIAYRFVYIIPAIAQKILNDADLPIYAARILDPTPDTVSFSIDTSLKIPAGLSVRIDPFSLSLFNREAKPMVPVLDLSVDSYKLKGTTNISIITNNTAVLDRAQFIQTLTKAVYSKRFTLSAKGSTTGHLGALKAGVTLDKDVELDGQFLWVLYLNTSDNEYRARQTQWFFYRRSPSYPTCRRRWDESERNRHIAQPFCCHICFGESVHR